MARNSLKGVCGLIDEVTEDVPVEQSFLNDLKRSIEKTDMANMHKPSTFYKPSSLTCIRNMYFQRIGADIDLVPSNYCSIGICNSGSDIHLRIQAAVENMKNNGIDCEYVDVADYIASRGIENVKVIGKSGMETKLHHTELDMHFMCDGLIRYRGQYYIIEFKTETGFKWNGRTGVDTKHYAQGTAYSYALNLPRVLFVYISRDLLDMKAYMFEPTDEMKDELVGKIDLCEQYVNAGECPPKPDNVDKRSCRYCSYEKLCGGIK